MMKNYSTKSHLKLADRISQLESKTDHSELWVTLKKNLTEIAKDKSPEELAQEEFYWREVRSSYVLHENFINLNHGTINPMPIPVKETLVDYLELCNELPGYWFFEGFREQKEKIRQRLAKLVGVSPDELSLQRNTSSAIETVIMGYPLEAGDEVILSHQDYPTLVYAWQQREKYDGISLKWVDVQMPGNNKKALIEPYLNAVSSKTKLIQVMQLFNWNGQIIPLEDLCTELKDSGVEVLGDGAHIPGHLQINITKTGVDYWGASLHKWLSAPIGTGILTVKRDKIERIVPLMAAETPHSDDIRKFETFGIHNSPLEMTISRALDYLELVGLDNKTHRLHFLKNYALDRLEEIKKVDTHTVRDREFSAGLGMFSIEGMKPAEVQEKLFNDYCIYTVGFEYGGLAGVRISPNIYHSLKELDRLIEAVAEIAR